jgi:anti-sigma factor RsiW
MRRQPEPAASCEEVLALLDAWPDGELSAEEAGRIERHAALCPACAEEVALARRLSEELRGLPPLVCPPEVTRRVLAVAAAQARASGEDAAAAAATSPSGGAPGRSLWSLLFGRLTHRGAPPGTGSAPRRPPSDLRGSWLRPALAGALVATLTGAGALVLTRRPPEPRPSAEELARAEIEIKLAFAYLGRVGREAGVRVRDEVMANVIAPTQRAIAGGEAARP